MCRRVGERRPGFVTRALLPCRRIVPGEQPRMPERQTYRIDVRAPSVELWNIFKQFVTY